MSNEIGGSFPREFLWGVSTSGHQEEGEDMGSDWYDWEQKQANRPKAGRANELWSNPKKFLGAAKELNLNAIRMSVERSRVNTQKGRVDHQALDHYREIFDMANEMGLTVMATLHHFTNPKWFAQSGGWEKGENIGGFEDFVGVCAQAFADVKLWCVINEPNVYMMQGYVKGEWPPEKRNPLLGLRAYVNMARAHRQAREILKQADDRNQVGSAVHMFDVRGMKPLDGLVSWAINESFWYMTGKDDYRGVNYYRPLYLRHGKEERKIPVNDLGWLNEPRGLGKVLKQAGRDGSPVIVTENGTADKLDANRAEFIIESLGEVMKAIQAGVSVKGYFPWSLLDNYEWTHGYDAFFGFYSVDRSKTDLTFRMRPSARVYAEICRTGRLPQ